MQLPVQPEMKRHVHVFKGSGDDGIAKDVSDEAGNKKSHACRGCGTLVSQGAC